MRFVAFDTETSLIRAACTAPPITCLSWASVETWIHESDELPRQTFLGHELEANLPRIYETVRGWLLEDEVTLVGHNVAFDLAVLGAGWPDLIPLIYAKYEKHLVTDTMLRQKLLDIAGGCYRGYLGPDNKWIPYNYSLQLLAARLVGMPIKKEGFRLFYGPFHNIPLERWVQYARHLQARGVAYRSGQSDSVLDYLRACLDDDKVFFRELDGMIAASPEEVVTYPKDDARATLAVFLAQSEHEALLENQWWQAKYAWWRHLASAWGLRTNPLRVAKLSVATQKVIAEIQARLVAEGLVRPNGSRDTKAAKERMIRVCTENGFPIRMTAGGEKKGPEPALDADACKATGDPVMKDYADLTSFNAVGNKDIPALAAASILPIHTKFDIAETGRTTSSNPNVQNWRRLPGIRECFVPRPGRVFIQADYSGLELCTLAQVCIDIIGRSRLAEVLNEGKDPHAMMACEILTTTLKRPVSYEEGMALKKAKDPRFDDARQTSKVANFGFPGGLGAKRLVYFARKAYNVELTEARAKKLKQEWFAAWPEMKPYFDFISSLQTGDGDITMRQLRSNRIRGGASYTAACNGHFQGLGADATQAAGWLVSKACYVDRSSPLFGSRIVNYIHDELICESDEAKAPEAAEELSRLMVAGAQPWIPDVKLSAEPCVMRVWSKEAKTLRDNSGRLMAWAPEEKQAA